MPPGARHRSSSRKKTSEGKERDNSLPPLLDRGNSTPGLGGRAASLGSKGSRTGDADRPGSCASDPVKGSKGSRTSDADRPGSCASDPVKGVPSASRLSVGARPPRPPGEKWWITSKIQNVRSAGGGYAPVACGTPKVNLTPLDNAPQPPLPLLNEQLKSGYLLQKEDPSRNTATAPLRLGGSSEVEFDEHTKGSAPRQEVELVSESQVQSADPEGQYIISDRFCCSLCETGSDDSGAPVVRFSRGGAVLTSFSLRPLAVVLEALTATPDLGLTVIGHARVDEDAGLALKRAEVSVKHLCSKGIDDTRLKVAVCKVSGSMAGSAVTFVRTPESSGEA